MAETAHPLRAADLLEHGTYTLRRALDRLALRRTAPLDPPRAGQADPEDAARRGAISNEAGAEDADAIVAGAR